MAASVGFTPSAGLDLAFGDGAGAAVARAKLLVVGAGGIGCELLKNLAATGFRGVALIDLDTIDVSNLNRQFLFRRRHVGAPKADTAAAQVEALVPGAAVAPRVGNIKDKAFDADYFRGFDVVLNALDNVEARRHVNRMCLGAGVPLVDSGSTGYNGHVAVIKGGATECYDCTPKAAQKVYAVCTIRSTPDKPVHCVVWAKALFDLMFGPEDASNVLADLDGGGSTPRPRGSLLPRMGVQRRRRRPHRRQMGTAPPLRRLVPAQLLRTPPLPPGPPPRPPLLTQRQRRK